MYTKEKILAVIIVLIGISSCRHSSKSTVFYADSAGIIKALYISDREINRLGVKHAEICVIEESNPIICPGILFLPPENIVTVVTPLSGRLNSLYCKVDQYVMKGEKLATIQNIDFIELQQQYLEARNQLEYYKAEYARQGELTVENATSMKKLQIARRDFQSAELRFNSLGLQIRTMGITPDSIKQDHLSSSFPIYASYSGVVSEIFIQPGGYCENGISLLEISTKQRLLVKINVPEEIYHLMKIGETIECQLKFDSLSTFKAKIISLPRRIDPVNHTAIISAELYENNSDYIPGMSVKVKIASDKQMLWLMKSNAILHEEKNNFIFLKHEGRYLKIPVKVEYHSQQMVKISGLSSEMKDSVVVSGIKHINTFFN